VLDVLFGGAQGFACSLDVLFYGGLGISKLQFLSKKVLQKISAVFFFLKFFRIGSGSESLEMLDSGPDPQHWFKQK
jgi:hypothetical protein